MWLTTKEISAILIAIEFFVNNKNLKDEQMGAFNRISEKFLEYLNYDLGLEFSKERSREVDELIKSTDGIFQEYAQFASDISQIYTVEEMKRTLMNLIDTVKERALQMDTKIKYAEVKAKMYRDKIALELKDSKEVGSKTEASLRASVDPRYAHILADLEEYELASTKLLARSYGLDKLFTAMVQSISVGRIGMNREVGQL